MIKKLIVILIIILLNFGLTFLDPVIAGDAPTLNCVGLPGCVDTDIKAPTKANVSNANSLNWISKIIGEAIKYVSVIAVISLILSGFLYLFSGGEEEKTKKAKTWIIWSLVGVLLSISAWGIITMINATQI